MRRAALIALWLTTGACAIAVAVAIAGAGGGGGGAEAPGKSDCGPGPPAAPNATAGNCEDAEVISPPSDGGRKVAAGLARGLSTLAVAVGGLLVPSDASGAKPIVANPASLEAVFDAARGDRPIALASGDYGTFHGSIKPDRVTLRALPGARATIALDFDPAANIAISGVTVTDANIVGPRTRNITIRDSDVPGQVTLRDLENANVTLEDNVFRDFVKCDGCAEGRIFVSGDDATANGVTIAGNEFRGGVSDGVQVGARGTRIIGNQFHDLLPGTPDGVHTDAIQLYGSSHTLIRGNFFRRVPTAIMAPDGAEREVIENNVIAGDPDGYPYAVTLWSDDGSVIRHNTFADGPCDFNLRCGILSIGSKDGMPAGRGTVIVDNILNDVGIGDGSAAVATRSHNLLFGGRPGGPGESRGRPVFVGGANPDTRSGYALAKGSPGRGEASDGGDVGAVIRTGRRCASARRSLRGARADLRRAHRDLRRSQGQRAKRRGQRRVRRAKQRVRRARARVRAAC